MAMLFALSIPGLVIAMLALCFVDQVLLRTRPGLALPWRGRAGMSSTGFDLLQTVFQPGRQHELDRRHTELLRRDDDEEGAPPRSRVDLVRGTATLRVPSDPHVRLPRRLPPDQQDRPDQRERP